MSTPRAFQRLDDRLAGRPIDQTMYPGVPTWLERPLSDWLYAQVGNDASGRLLAERVVLRLRLEPYTNVSHVQRIVDHIAGDERMTVVDAVVQLHHGWRIPSNSQTLHGNFMARIDRLDDILSDGASAYRVSRESRCLVRRVDATVESAAQAAIQAAPTASDHLRQAWVATYGMSPDPDKALHEAIRAVEEIACPLVENRRAEKNSATLGTVLGELRKNSYHKWELVLPANDGQPRDIEHFLGMMDMLWQAQVSRHGGGTNSRRQDKAEAEAAVQLAVLLVHWLATGVLRRKL